MLGPFLGIGQEFFGQAGGLHLRSLRGGRVPAKRANRHDPVFDADHDLRRTADQVHAPAFSTET